MSASPHISSVSFKSRIITPSAFPTATPAIKSLIGIPASASAKEAAINETNLDPASACNISVNTSIAVLGNSSTKTADSKASLITLESSISLLLGAGFFLSSVENGVM
uniref:Uncharacterized protein ORF-c20_025 n=1 Tax=Saccharolobus solfataricus TaxID=2287 RepID=Q9UXC1_SACSO|nr:hypothetical protein [Saccharolobus solfataricus P2]